MKKILGILLILLAIIGCGRVKDGGTDAYGTNTGYDAYNGGTFIYYGKAYSGTVDAVAETIFGGTTDNIVGSYQVKDGRYISKFEKYPLDPSKEFDKNIKYYTGKVKYNKSDNRHYGTIELNKDMYGEVEGAWNLNPLLVAKKLQNNTFFGKQIADVLNGSILIDKADIRTYPKTGYHSEAKIRDKHILEYELTNANKDETYIEYEASKMNKDGSFEVEITLYKHTVKSDEDQWTGMNKFRESDTYKNTKKITINGLAKYKTYKRDDFFNGSVTKTEYSTIILDPTTTYTVSGGFGKTLYDDMMYKVKPNNPGVVNSNEFRFDNVIEFDNIMEELFILSTKEQFNQWINSK